MNQHVYSLLAVLFDSVELGLDLLQQLRVPLVLEDLLRALQIMLGRVRLILVRHVHHPQHLQRLPHVNRGWTVHLFFGFLGKVAGTSISSRRAIASLIFRCLISVVAILLFNFSVFLLDSS